jgi:hypothetical protein
MSLGDGFRDSKGTTPAHYPRDARKRLEADIFMWLLQNHVRYRDFLSTTETYTAISSKLSLCLGCWHFSVRDRAGNQVSILRIKNQEDPTSVATGTD